MRTWTDIVEEFFYFSFCSPLSFPLFFPSRGNCQLVAGTADKHPLIDFLIRSWRLVYPSLHFFIYNKNRWLRSFVCADKAVAWLVLFAKLTQQTRTLCCFVLGFPPPFWISSTVDQGVRIGMRVMKPTMGRNMKLNVKHVFSVVLHR